LKACPVAAKIIGLELKQTSFKDYSLEAGLLLTPHQLCHYLQSAQALVRGAFFSNEAISNPA